MHATFIYHNVSNIFQNIVSFKGFLPRVLHKSANTKFIKQIIVDKYSLKK